MNGGIRRRGGARQDLIEIFRHHVSEGGLAVARRFRAQAEETINRLASMPGMGTRYEPEHPDLGEVRYFPLPSRFKRYLIFYRGTPDGIEVVRVLHGARDIAAILADEFGQGDGDVDAAEDGG